MTLCGLRWPIAISSAVNTRSVLRCVSIARSNLIAQKQRATRQRGHYRRQGGDELLQAIRQLTDARPTYGYRRITAHGSIAPEALQASKPVNHKRAFRLMRQVHLLQPRTSSCIPCGRMRGSVIASASNRRWSSGVLEVGCWNGEVSASFAIDTCDREIIAWPTTAATLGPKLEAQPWTIMSIGLRDWHMGSDQRVLVANAPAGFLRSASSNTSITSAAR
jgi:hypothetical protein